MLKNVNIVISSFWIRVKVLCTKLNYCTKERNV